MIIIGIQFSEVGGDEDGILFDSIKGDFVDYDNIQRSYTNPKGRTALRDYYYFTKEGGFDNTGWHDENWDYIGDTEYFPRGMGAWFSGDDGPKNVTHSGEVKKGHFIHTFTDPMTFTCSAYPTAFKPNSANVSWLGVGDYDNIQIAYTKPNGRTALRDFYYFTVDGGFEADAWYDEDWSLLDADAVVAGPGEGFWFSPNDPASATFTEVSPLGDVD